MIKTFTIIALLSISALAFGQTYAFLPPPRAQFIDGSGSPLSGGFLYSYAAGTSTPLATEHLDTLGGISPNTNPVILDSTGSAEIRLLPQFYKFVLQDSSHSQIWAVDQVADLGQIALNSAVLLAPAGASLQTVIGPIAASFFQGTASHTTSPGVRISLIDPLSALDTVTNPPSLLSVAPAIAGQTDAIPDGGALNSTFVLSPGPPNWVTITAYALNAVILPYTSNPCDFTFIVTTTGTSGASNPVFSTTPCGSSPATVADGSVVWTKQSAYVNSNQLDCTAAGLTCKRTAYIYLEGAGCNNTTASSGWDTLGTNSPTPFCITGTNIQKGVLALPGAATLVQQNTGTGAAAGTCTTTYPGATGAGDLLEVEVAVDGGKTVTGVTDGTNAYSKAVSIANGNTDLEIWYFANTSAAKAAATTLTVTLSAGANCALEWKEYAGVVTGDSGDKTATNTGTGTAVTSGTTASTFQAVELVLAAVASPSNPTIVGQAGFVPHTVVAQSTNVSVASEGLIQQTAITQSGSFTLGSSQAWASAVATFKINVAGAPRGQRHVALPVYYLASAPVNANIKWQANVLPLGASQVTLAAEIVCTADGSSDDPTFNISTSATPNVPASSTGTLITTPLPNLVSTGCAAGNLMHFRIERLRYNPTDTFEGYVLVNGATLQFGISQ